MLKKQTGFKHTETQRLHLYLQSTSCLSPSSLSLYFLPLIKVHPHPCKLPFLFMSLSFILTSFCSHRCQERDRLPSFWLPVSHFGNYEPFDGNGLINTAPADVTVVHFNKAESNKTSKCDNVFLIRLPNVELTCIDCLCDSCSLGTFVSDIFCHKANWKQKSLPI